MLLRFDLFRVLLVGLLLFGLAGPAQAQRAVDYLKRPIDKARENVEKYNSKRDLGEILDADKKPKSGDSETGATSGADSINSGAQSPETGEAPEIDVPEEAAEEKEGPVPSDASSLRLMDNFATVIGAKSKSDLRNVVAKGTFSYGKDVKDFELVETSRGERCFVLEWHYLGRTYREENKSIPPSNWAANDGVLSREISKKVFASNGEATWESVYAEVIRGGQVLHRRQFGETVVSYGRKLTSKPLVAEDRAVIAGGYAEVSPGHFQNVYLLLQPILRNTERQMDFKYTGQENLLGRTVFVVRHTSKRFFYFDAEKFLLVQWGGQSRLGGRTLLVDYRSTAFKRSSSVLFPSRIELVAEQETLGSYEIEAIEVNANLEAGFFDLPRI